MDNKEDILANQLIRQQERLKTDIQYKLARNLRNRLYYALKGNTKSKSTLELLGCSIAELKSHLESKFLPGMTWDNYGKWHIDHIVPLILFNLTLEEDQKQACNFTNLQPLWAKDNLKKGPNPNF